MWKILNNKNETAFIHLNDPDRRSISSISNTNLRYLSPVSESFKKQGSSTTQRVPGTITFTKPTISSITRTLDGLIDLSHSLLKDKAVKFLLLAWSLPTRLVQT